MVTNRYAATEVRDSASAAEKNKVPARETASTASTAKLAIEVHIRAVSPDSRAPPAPINP